jgi:hypothetical protein
MEFSRVIAIGHKRWLQQDDQGIIGIGIDEASSALRCRKFHATPSEPARTDSIEQPFGKDLRGRRVLPIPHFGAMSAWIVRRIEMKFHHKVAPCLLSLPLALFARASVVTREPNGLQEELTSVPPSEGSGICRWPFRPSQYPPRLAMNPTIVVKMAPSMPLDSAANSIAVKHNIAMMTVNELG